MFWLCTYLATIEFVHSSISYNLALAELRYELIVVWKYALEKNNAMGKQTHVIFSEVKIVLS